MPYICFHRSQTSEKVNLKIVTITHKTNNLYVLFNFIYKKDILMGFSIYNNDNSKVNKLDLKVGNSWADSSKTINNKIYDSLWNLVDNGDGKIQQNEMDMLNKLLEITDNLCGKTDQILDNEELNKLKNVINNGHIKDLLDTRTYGTVKGSEAGKLTNFSYLERGKLYPYDPASENQGKTKTNKNLVNVDYSNLKLDKNSEYYIDTYTYTENPDGSKTAIPVITKKQDSGQGRNYNWSEGLDRTISKISIASYYYENDKGNQLPEILNELKAIGKEVGFEVEEIGMESAPWVEDYGVRRADGKVLLLSNEAASNAKYGHINNTIDPNRIEISKSTQGKSIENYKEFKNTVQENDIVESKSFLEGGNVLNTCLADGTAGAVIGKESINYTLNAMKLKNTPENVEKAKLQIAEDLGIKPENITFIPQFDFHIDMSYRPLHNGEIAIPDYEEGIRILRETQISGMDETAKSELINKLEELNTKSASIRTEAEKALSDGGYKIVKIPCFSDNGKAKINYMNGVGGTSKNGESFYITNKSDYPELNEAVQKYFKNAGIDKIYFVSTQPFLDSYGGIDCMTQEV